MSSSRIKQLQADFNELRAEMHETVGHMLIVLKYKHNRTGEERFAAFLMPPNADADMCSALLSEELGLRYVFKLSDDYLPYVVENYTYKPILQSERNAVVSAVCAKLEKGGVAKLPTELKGIGGVVVDFYDLLNYENESHSTIPNTAMELHRLELLKILGCLH